MSGDAPATADAVFAKVEAWQQPGTWTVVQRKSPELLQLRRALPGQNRTGRLDFVTSAGATAGTTKYEIRVWTELLGIKTRQNDVEMVVNAKDLASALSCPAAKWTTCP